MENIVPNKSALFIFMFYFVACGITFHIIVKLLYLKQFIPVI